MTLTTLFLATTLWLCEARSSLGRKYHATAATKVEAKAAAIKECQAHAVWRRVTSCEQVSR